MERVVLSADLPVQQPVPRRGAAVAQAGHAVDGVDGEAEAVGAVADGQLERGVDVALFEVADDVQVVLALALVRQAVDEPGVAVEVEDDGLVVGEDGLELGVGAAVRVLGLGDQLEEVDDVDEADLVDW